MKTKRYTQSIIVTLLLASLILFGGQCAQKEKAAEGPFFGGNKGIDLSFVSGAPPSEFSQGESVPLKLRLLNSGETIVKAGEAKVKVFGIYTPSFGISDQYRATQGDLLGMSPLIKEGGEQEVELDNIRYTLPVANFEDFDLRSKVCYPYKTRSQVKICMGSLLEQERGGEQVCALTGEKLKTGSVSAAPVQITSITQEPYSTNQVLFKVTIENKGKGEVYNIDSTC